jgi:hypothetical protein
MLEKLTIYIFPSGLGDAVMASAVALKYRCQTGKAMYIGHKCNEVFINNPDFVCHPEYDFWSLTTERIRAAESSGISLVCLYYFGFEKLLVRIGDITG